MKSRRKPFDMVVLTTLSTCSVAGLCHLLSLSGVVKRPAAEGFVPTRAGLADCFGPSSWCQEDIVVATSRLLKTSLTVVSIDRSCSGTNCTMDEEGWRHTLSQLTLDAPKTGNSYNHELGQALPTLDCMLLHLNPVALLPLDFALHHD